MRTLPLAAVCSVATAAHAAPAANPTWADLVGDHQASLEWKNCTTPGAKTAVITVDAIDGALSIDLSRAGGGLRALSLVEENTRWTAQQGDVSVTVQRSAS